MVHLSARCVNVEGCCETSAIWISTSATRRRLFDGALDRGKRALERRARLVHDGLPEDRALDAGQPFLLRTLERQQIEPVRGDRRSVVDAHRHVQGGVKVMRGV